jgi:hypothetical protein
MIASRLQQITEHFCVVSMFVTLTIFAGPLTIRRLQAALAEAGMHIADPRLKQVHARLQSLPSDTLTFESFKFVIESASLLIYRALTHKLVIPDWNSFIKEIDQIYRDCAGTSKGKLAR